MGEQRKPLVTTSSVVFLEYILTADSEYMPIKPEIVGSSPTRAAAPAVAR